MTLKNRIFMFLAFFIFLVLISDLGSDLTSNVNNNESSIINRDEVNRENDENVNDLPITSNLDPFNKSNYFDVIDEPFDNLNDWTSSTSGGANVAIVSGILRIRGDADLSLEYANVTYNVALPSLIHGEISFDYIVAEAGLGNVDIRCDVSEDGSSWGFIWRRIVAGSGNTGKIDISSYNTSKPTFNVRFSFSGRFLGDEAQIDNFTLSTHEFFVSELNDDPVSTRQDQELSIFVCPNFTNWEQDNVTLRYKINSADVGSGTPLTAPETSNNYTFTIPKSDYNHSDIVYYQISISSSTDGIHKSDIFSFSVDDSFPPTISNVQINDSTVMYYEDVEISCNIVENLDDAGLKSVVMYISNSTPFPGPSDTVITSNWSTIPKFGGDCKFVITKDQLSATILRNILFYIINATDFADNSQYEVDSFFVSDDIEPNIKLYQVYAPPNGIENNESLTVCYNITEPLDGSGLNGGALYEPRLYVKINSIPSNGNDFDFSVVRDNDPPTIYGGLINFTIGQGNYSYGDSIYFFVNATDSSLNLNANSTFDSPFPANQIVFANDTYAPRVFNHSSNGLDAIYNKSKTLTFNITEPVGAAGINNDSLIFYYWIGKMGGINEINVSLSIYGGEINFTIDHNEYLYDQTVYYQLNVSDNAGNEYSMGNGSFYIGDPYAPLIGSYSYSNIQPEYTDDFNITLSVWEDNLGSNFSSAVLLVKNGSIGGWGTAIKIFETNSSLLVDRGGNFSVYFKINSSITYARYMLNWSLTVVDNANNQRTFIGAIKIHDYINPSIKYADLNNATIGLDTFEYDEHAMVYYDILEPIQGSGFNTSGEGLILYYRNGDIGGPDIFDDSAEVYNSSVLDYGGRYAFIIPESFLVYGNTIYFWLNATDKQGNLNGTWNDRHSITVDDITSPDVVLNPLNILDISYHLDKSINFTPSELSDSSGLKNATLYWRKGLPPTPLLNDGFIDYAGAISPVGGNELEIILSRIALSFRYLDDIFIIIVVFDEVGNNKTTAAQSFTIIDTVDPDYVEDAANTADWTWRANKTLIFDVFDPDYDLSSGIKNITLYYRVGMAPTIYVYNGTRVNSTPTLERSFYTFEVELNQSLFLESPNMFYFIRIYDVAGNFEDSSFSLFILHNDIFIENTIDGPNNGEWIGDGEVYFFIDLYIATDLFIFINGENIDSLARVNIDIFDDKIELDKEDDYIIEFKFFFNLSIKTFTFSLDLYAPEQITEIDSVIYGLNVIEISWSSPEGIDDESYYEIYRSTDPNFEISTAGISIMDGALIARIEAGESLLIEDDDIVAGTTYYYIIVAIDRVGHVSIPSEPKKVQVPANILIPVILMIIIGAIAAVSLVMIRKKISAKRRDLLLSQVDLKDLNLGDDLIVDESKGPQWTVIQTTAEIKEEEGFEFDETLPAISRRGYWPEKLGHLISQAAQYELEKEYAKALQVYSILVRISKRINKPILTMRLESRKDQIYKLISE